MGEPHELVVTRVSERTTRIEFLRAGADAKGQPSSPVSASADALVKVTTEPLAIAVHRADGSLVQQLSFASGTNVAFRVTAQLLGLGEGAKQFDRRGAKYPMQPSWG